MKILFCTDGSEISYNAIKNCAKWLRGSVVDVICVVDWSYLPDSVVIEDTGFVNSCRNIADDILRYSEKIIESLNLQLGEKIKQCGGVVECIIETVNRNNYDLLVLGSNGKKGLQKWLGSVSKSVFYETQVANYISKRKNNSQKILFATDGSDDFFKVSDYVIKNFDLTGKEIYLCCVIEDPDLLFLSGTLDDNWKTAIDKKQNSDALFALKKLKIKFEDSGLKVKILQVLPGIPEKSIIDYSKSEDIDLIVTVSHANRNKRRFLIDAVSGKIVENVKSDVLVIKL